MNKSNNLSLVKYRVRWAINDYLSTVASITQERELEGLTRWAKKKKLDGVARHYENLLVKTQSKLFYTKLKCQRIYQLSMWTDCILGQLFSRSYRKGYAKKYNWRSRISY